MKRRVFNWVTILMVVFMGIGYTSCNDNDDNDDDNSDDLRSSLIGTWVDYEFFDHNEDGYWFTFREDGTGTYEELGNTYDFTYKVKGNELTITEKSGDEIYHFVISNGQLYLYATDTGELDFILSKSGNRDITILGTWRCDWSDTGYTIITFYANGTGTYTEKENGETISEIFKYTFDTNTMTLKCRFWDDDEGDYTDEDKPWHINKLTAKTMIIDGYTYTKL